MPDPVRQLERLIERLKRAAEKDDTTIVHLPLLALITALAMIKLGLI